MREQHTGLLDRLYARHQQRVDRVAVPEAWSPPWQPRGRWWMRSLSLRTWRARAAATARSWRRLTRPPRAS